ncbi:formimidoylglutamase [Ectobacillus sp. JY-23]|uniref:formimidoylglutamase n=1 Tax=Ectobacillus sp. JY-23 TaxID=2933872 RepID=UPI001FF2747A|nr:formimidoylglutamase [Ectobacillus sp. JY-23]UOY93555.1 formimidoylglutamase [Ectobacillus sp. JY-23]
MEEGAILYPYLKQKARFVDREVTKWSDIVKTWNGMDVIQGPALIGVPLAKTSISHSGAHLSPDVIRSMLDVYSTYHMDSEQDMKKTVLHDCGNVEMHVTDLHQCHKRIEQTMHALMVAHPNMLPIILGGDHSISFPSISGFAKHKGKVGVIQFDAHHDVRNLEDGGPSNGTPFRNLIEGGHIRGEHLVQIGIRNFSNAKSYHTYVKQHHVHVYEMKKVEKMGIVAILTESINKLRSQVDSIYVSVDMDVLDQAFAPGCPAIGPGGMSSGDLLEAVELLAKESLVEAMDIVEIDPTLDFRDMTSRLAAHLIMTFITMRQ